MADDLGARLVQAGLITPRQLAEVLGAAPPHEGALVRALVHRGLDDTALAGFFVAAGFGPLLSATDLARADGRARASLTGRMGCELLALPIRRSPAGLIVAMAAPTDAHAIAEIRRAVRIEVLPVVARVGELLDALSRAYPHVALPPPLDPPRTIESEPPVLELVNVRRSVGEPKRADDLRRSPRGPDRVEARALLGPQFVTEDQDGVVPLVRQKPVVETATRRKSVTRSFETLAPSVPAARLSVAERTSARAPAAAAQHAGAPPERRFVVPREHERWEDENGEPVNKVDPCRLRAITSAPKRALRPPPIGTTLAAMRASHDRDEVVGLACRAALTVCRAVVLLALRKGVLKGWDGAGGGLTRDVVRNLWIPTNSPSMFRDVVAKAEPYEGPPKTSAADGLFRAAVGSRGGEVAIQPVVIAGKVAAVLAADGVGYGREGSKRIEVLARAIAEALERIIVESKLR
jgi:hypothetical protein